MNFVELSTSARRLTGARVNGQELSLACGNTAVVHRFGIVNFEAHLKTASLLCNNIGLDVAIGTRPYKIKIFHNGP